MPILDEAIAIAKAASDVGIRLAFALAVRDQNPIVYGDSADVLATLPEEARNTIQDLFIRPSPTPSEYLDRVEAIHAAIAGPMIDVQFGPAGVQWCSPAMLEAIAERSAATGRRVHMHLLETIYQRQWADRAFPAGVVRFLKDIGLLSDRLTLAHCIHARPDELDMIAECRRDHRDEFQLQSASAFRPRADRRCTSPRLPDRRWHRRRRARRGRRCDPRDAARADGA